MRLTSWGLTKKRKGITLALPVVMLFVLGGFGDTPDPEGVFDRGVGPMTYYVPAYVALALASMGLIGLPVHLAGYREHGVLRRCQASCTPVWVVFAAQVVVTIWLAHIGALSIVGLGWLSYDVAMPSDLMRVLVASVAGGVAFARIGLLPGAVLRTARAAQGAGIMLWCVMLVLGGPGPPPVTLTSGMRTAADLLPLRHVIVAIQDTWLGRVGMAQNCCSSGESFWPACSFSIRFFRWQ